MLESSILLSFTLEIIGARIKIYLQVSSKNYFSNANGFFIWPVRKVVFQSENAFYITRFCNKVLLKRFLTSTKIQEVVEVIPILVYNEYVSGALKISNLRFTSQSNKEQATA